MKSLSYKYQVSFCQKMIPVFNFNVCIQVKSSEKYYKQLETEGNYKEAVKTILPRGYIVS